MRRDPQPRAARAASRTRIDEILKYAGAKDAFEKLCKAGCKRDWLTLCVLYLPRRKPSKNRKVFRKLKRCRELVNKLAALLSEINDLDLVYIPFKPQSKGRVRPLVYSKEVPAEYFTNLREQFENLPDKFDVPTLRQQLRAGIAYFRQLGAASKPTYSLEANDFSLGMLLSYVKEKTGRDHYSEIAALATAATLGSHTFTPNALKQSTYRNRISNTKPPAALRSVKSRRS